MKSIASCLILCLNTGIGTNTGSNENTDTNNEMAKPKKPTRLFLLSWDMYGLESLVDLTTLENLRIEEEKLRMVRILGDPEARDPGDQTGAALNRAVQSVLLRARVNSQRHYEVYTVQVDHAITEHDLWSMFNQDPQTAADLIRKHGRKLWGDRLGQHKVVIS